MKEEISFQIALYFLPEALHEAAFVCFTCYMKFHLLLVGKVHLSIVFP